jgi:oxygen-independent coproporphyrinogen-3 oxidase
MAPASSSSALYLHIPFCLSRCNYCTFTSYIQKQADISRYLDALTIEFEHLVYSNKLESIYIGGGTPTCLSLKEIEKWLVLLSGECKAPGCEFTVEANPGTLTMDKLMLLRTAGVNRLSIGCQTFCEKGLQILGRTHNVRQTEDAIAMAREAGFDNISLDLIFGWPGQTPCDWGRDMEKAVALGVEHISAYCLSYESGSPLEQLREAGKITPLTEDEERDLFDMTGEFFPAAGLMRYEISNFARLGHECRHNLNYWKGGEYFGLGLAAHSHVGQERFANTCDLEEYVNKLQLEGSACVFREKLPPEKYLRELTVIWLRLAAGINLREFRARTGAELMKALGQEITPLVRTGWLAWSDNHERLFLTEKALPVADSVLAELV